MKIKIKNYEYENIEVGKEESDFFDNDGNLKLCD